MAIIYYKCRCAWIIRVDDLELVENSACSLEALVKLKNIALGLLIIRSDYTVEFFKRNDYLKYF